MNERWSVAHVDEIPRPGGAARIPLRQHFGILAFGINAWTTEKEGARVIPQHDETPRGHEEIYIVLRGRATFVIDEEEIDAPTGTAICISDPRVLRTAFAREAPLTVLTVGATPGEAFQPSPWELWASECQPLVDAGDDEGAIARCKPLLEQHPNEANLFLHVARCEARVGRHDEAIEHLRKALEIRPMWLYLAELRDFDPIRDDPRFPA